MRLKADYRQIWQIAYPVIIGNFAESLISFTDTAFMGRIGEAELAAIGYVSLFYFILYTIGYGYTKGTQILIARKLGEGYPRAVGAVTDNSTIVLLLFAGVVFVLFRYFAHPLLDLILAQPAIVEKSVEYITIRSWGIFFSFLATIFMAVFMGIARTRIILWTILVMSALNVLLNWIMVFGKLGVPPMGIRGAAWASNIAEVVAVLIYLVYVYRSGIYEKYHLFTFSRIRLTVIREISKLSFPLVLQYIIGLSAWFTFFTLIEKMGSHALAVSNVVKNIYVLCGLITWGLASSANTVISNIMGQGKPDMAILALRKIVILSVAACFLVSIPLWLVPEMIIRIYTADPAIIHDGAVILRVTNIALYIFSVATILFNGIVSTGSTRISLLIEISSIVIYLIYVFTTIVVLNVDLITAWTSEWVYWLSLGSISFIYLKSGRWKNIALQI